MKIAIIDVETTGLDPVHDRIIEVGLVLMEDFKITSSYSWLVKPGVMIPSRITQLTGIENHMVLECDDFNVLAPLIDSLTQGYYFCGHNASFDYQFIKSEMNRSGMEFERSIICTARFAREIFPDRRSYSLKSLCARFGISNEHPHRALPDAKATGVLLMKLVSWIGQESFQMRNLNYEKQLRKQTIRLKKLAGKLPEATGVYLFIGKNGKPVYIGKAINIRKRVRSHFSSGNVDLAQEISMGNINDFDFHLTGSELMSALVEDHLIRKYWPKLNRAQKSYNRRYGTVAYRDRLDRWRMAVATTDSSRLCMGRFYLRQLAREYVGTVVGEYQLNGHLCGVITSGEVSVTEHNIRFEKMLEDFNSHASLQVFFLPGPLPDDYGFIVLENSVYIGFGYIKREEEKNYDLMLKCMTKVIPSAASESLVRKFILNRKPDLEVLLQKKTVSGSLPETAIHNLNQL
jgi:DNA polymerase III subunit epsilon